MSYNYNNNFFTIFIHWIVFDLCFFVAWLWKSSIVNVTEWSNNWWSKYYISFLHNLFSPLVPLSKTVKLAATQMLAWFSLLDAERWTHTARESAACKTPLGFRRRSGGSFSDKRLVIEPTFELRSCHLFCESAKIPPVKTSVKCKRDLVYLMPWGERIRHANQLHAKLLWVFGGGAGAPFPISGW